MRRHRAQWSIARNLLERGVRKCRDARDDGSRMAIHSRAKSQPAGYHQKGVSQHWRRAFASQVRWRRPTYQGYGWEITRFGFADTNACRLTEAYR